MGRRVSFAKVEATKSLVLNLQVYKSHFAIRDCRVQTRAITFPKPTFLTPPQNCPDFNGIICVSNLQEGPWGFSLSCRCAKCLHLSALITKVLQDPSWTSWSLVAGPGEGQEPDLPSPGTRHTAGELEANLPRPAELRLRL